MLIIYTRELRNPRGHRGHSKKIPENYDGCSGDSRALEIFLRIFLDLREELEIFEEDEDPDSRSEFSSRDLATQR